MKWGERERGKQGARDATGEREFIFALICVLENGLSCPGGCGGMGVVSRDLVLDVVTGRVVHASEREVGLL
jgi:hypothetical protein